MHTSLSFPHRLPMRALLCTQALLHTCTCLCHVHGCLIMYCPKCMLSKPASRQVPIFLIFLSSIHMWVGAHTYIHTSKYACSCISRSAPYTDALSYTPAPKHSLFLVPSSVVSSVTLFLGSFDSCSSRTLNAWPPLPYLGQVRALCIVLV